jgi:hypothetical protein
LEALEESSALVALLTTMASWKDSAMFPGGGFVAVLHQEDKNLLQFLSEMSVLFCL